jgi:hypothetical protein
MVLLVNILSVIAILFGIGLVFAQGLGSLIAGAICVVAGMTAYDQESLVPLLMGFASLWVLRILGFEKR